ncbi:MAG: AIR synthase related protein [Eubacteriales bacterium]|nr:AIR synthase related protein [Eubacteriales bacterium]
MKLGKVSDTILSRSVFKLIRKRVGQKLEKPYLGQDASGFAAGDSNIALSSVACGYMAVYRAVNNIYAAGGCPVGILDCVILNDKAREIRLKEIIGELERQAAVAGIPILGGHTTVSEKVNQPVVTVTSLGVENVSRPKVKPGQDIVAARWIGISGIRQIIDAKQEEILKVLPCDVIDKALGNEKDMLVGDIAEVVLKSDSSVRMHDVSEGGIFASLWDLAESGNVGIDVDLRAIPVKQEIVEICELFNINPYELESLGCLLVTSDNGCDIVKLLNTCGIKATVIGKVTEGNQRIIRSNDEVRFLDLPQQDEIYKLLGKGATL